CHDEATARQRFGVAEPSVLGACFTRTGRRFFDDDATNASLITRLSAALGDAGVWERYQTGWLALDAEILPWSAKAQGLLRQQYAPVAAAGLAALAAVSKLSSRPSAGACHSSPSWGNCGRDRRMCSATRRHIDTIAGRCRGSTRYASPPSISWQVRGGRISSATTSGI